MILFSPVLLHRTDSIFLLHPQAVKISMSSWLRDSLAQKKGKWWYSYARAVFLGKSLVLLLKNSVFICLLDLLQQLSFKKDSRVMGYYSQDTGEISGSFLGRRCEGMGEGWFLNALFLESHGSCNYWCAGNKILIFYIELTVWERCPFQPICYKSNICIWK